MREGIRKRAEALGRDHEQRFAEVGRMVADNRIDRGMSQQELAVLCGTTQSAIARLERGGRPPKLDTLMRIADALDADLCSRCVYGRAKPSRIPGWRSPCATS